jgi:hypothetical protein
VAYRSDGIVRLAGSSIGETPLGKIEVESKTTIEYDGLILISLLLKYPGNWKPDSVCLSIPHALPGAQYYLAAMQKGTDYSGGIPKKAGVIMESKFSPYLWVGDNTKGLFWFCESNRNWPNAASKSAIQLTRNSRSVEVKFDLGHTAEYAFGLQATPVKPLPQDWRKWRFAPADNYNLTVPWPNLEKEKSVKYFGWPKAANDNIYRRMVDEYHQNGVKVLSYATITRLPSSLPEYKNNMSKWRVGTSTMKTKHDELVYVDPASPGYRNLIARDFAYYMRKYNLDGYYLDGTKLTTHWNKGKNLHYPIMAYRALHRALYDSVKSINPNAIIVAHMSMNMNIPVLAYVDGYVDGEQFRKKAETGKFVYNVKRSYLDIITIDQFRAEFIGKQWGIIPFFLPEFDPADRTKEQPTQALASLLLVHDVPPWPIYSNISVWNEMYHFLDSFGYSNSTFIPYYDNAPPAKVQDINSIYVSAYKKTGESLIVLANLSNNVRQTELLINVANLGLKKITDVYSLTDANTLSHVNNKITVSLDPMSYKMLWVK